MRLRKHYNSESSRRAALPAWLHFYNHHRPHTVIGKLPPITRLNNLPGHYSSVTISLLVNDPQRI